MALLDRLAPLRPYAAPLPSGSPPEILPWDHADPWGFDGAARAALGLLLEGEAPGPRLFALADYLLTFSLEGYGAIQFPDAPLLNATALALCGYLCHGAHPEADLWRVTGAARLASQLHQRRAAIDDRMAATCLLAVCQVADEVALPQLADLITLRERMWGRLLDHSRAERLHVSEADYPRHMREPVAADRVGTLLREREWQAAAWTPDYRNQCDVGDADQTCRNLITLRAHMLVRHQFGSEVDWHLRLFDDIESTVSLGSQPFIRNLAAAYRATGDDKYAVHAARLLWSFYRLAPLPNHRQFQGPWRTLEVGNRQCNMWPGINAALGQTEPFDAATHAMLARSRLEHMRYLLAYCGGANNWYQVESAGLAVAALFSPELTHADAYLRIALRRLRWINSFAYYDDGFQFELTHGYHVFPTSSLFSVVRVAQARGVALPPDFVTLVEKAHEMYLFARQPDYFLPTFNDCNPQPMDPAPLLLAAAETFGRDDLRWGGTHGAEGTSPDHASHAWTSAGYYAMRDGWSTDGQYLFFDGAPWGASHQHEDKLSFVLHAGGRLLLGDPNIYSYSRTELTHYFRSSRAHNVVLIDGKEQARKYLPEARLTTRGRNEWVSHPAFDFASSEYLEGFASNPYVREAPGSPVPAVSGAARSALPVPTHLETTLTHRRAIFYVKGSYWILCDLIQDTGGEAGQASPQRTLTQLFHVAPLIAPGSAEPVKAGQVTCMEREVLTAGEGLANLAILPVDTGDARIGAQIGETSPAAGWYGVLGEFPAWEVSVEAKRPLPARMDAVLVPLAVGASERPAVERLHQDAQTTAFRIAGAGIDDTFVLCEEGAGAVTLGDVVFEGRALLLRRAGELRAYAVNPVTLRVAGSDVAPLS